ncbi:MAG: glycosyltransferase [Bacteroidetes bacterium]|nr:glycosyltransferase [Bacteroidota bacterium]
MLNKQLHIISFDVPLPADYGGVIDVYNRIRHLHALGIEITLHCFTYGRKKNTDLNNFCKAVYYYPRSTSALNILHREPFIVTTRNHPDLLTCLLADDHPILFEGLHTTHFLSHPSIQNRIKMVRAHNIEHEYYRYLYNAEKNFFRKLYFLSESIKLKDYEKNLKYAQYIGAISSTDRNYFQKKWGHSFLLPPFHHFDEIKSKTGHGNYSLYHGNLGVAENEKAAIWLVEKISSLLNHPLIIAGSRCSTTLRNKISDSSNVTLIENPSDEKMEILISDAQVHLLPSFQESGIKLKLLHAIYSGRFVLVNSMMLSGTSLENACAIANDIPDFAQKANSLFSLPFTNEEIEKRKKTLFKNYDNESNAKMLIDQIFNS